jgi:L-lactate dehydrogenase complex protein LldF
MSVEAEASGRVTAGSFAERAHIALNDKPLRANFRRAMEG